MTYLKKLLFAAPLLALALPIAASAHQHAMLTVGGMQYSFVVGSLNEPIAVDDKTGVDLTITKGGHAAMSADGDMDSMTGAEPATGLETTLQVELSAGGSKKVFALSPVYGTPGAYKAPFYPTVATSISYRFFGTIDGNPIDVSFACLPSGATATEEGQKDLGGGVMQESRSGGFGCPVEKESLGFPEDAASSRSLADQSGSARTFGLVGVALGAVAIALGLRRRS